jgi:hypothetical protein
MPLIAAIHNGVQLEGYWVDSRDGTIWSTKHRNLKHIKGSNHDGYLRTVFMINGKKCALLLHRIVACTLIKFPPPTGVSKKDWSVTPESVKRAMSNLYLINHIDHNRANYHPSNLEWVTHTENAIASVKHKSARNNFGVEE